MPGDIAALSAVAREAKALWGYPAEWIRQWREELTIDESDLRRMTVLVAEVGGEIAGFGALERTDDGWEVAHLWIRPSHGRRGIGRTLLDALATHARTEGAKSLRIDADPHAAPFYERAGAGRVAEVPAPMPGAPERVLIAMELPLHS